MPVYHVSVLQTNRDYFDYQYEDPSLALGSRVWVPFRQSIKLGIIVGVNADLQATNLKSISQLFDEEPIVTKDILQLCCWVSEYYQAPLAQVLALALPKAYREGKTSTPLSVIHYVLNRSVEEAHKLVSPRALKQHLLLDYFADQLEPLTQNQIVKAGFAPGLLKNLFEKKVLDQTALAVQPSSISNKTHLPLSLNEEQQKAYDTIKAHLSTYHCFLLYGVTGSGKTEVYAQLIADVLAQDRQVLILVPEIGLTPQLLQRFQTRFAQAMVVIHSQMSDTERQKAWQWALEKRVQLVIGTRSALFTPMPNLGLIVIDEEHDTSLKQMEGVRYLARDTALMRAFAANIPIVLGSATPSLESLANVEKGKYTVLHLHHKAMNHTPLHFDIVDLRSQTLQHGLANHTLAIIKRHLKDNHQVLVFINRRGFSPVLLCHQCGWKADCRFCDTHLTLHKANHQLICHHCGYTQRPIIQCPNCQGRELIPVGAGTQRIEESLRMLLPTTSILRIDRDVVRKKHAFDQQLEHIHTGQAQLIIGTQMLAKGHHFSRLSLVVILDADNGFYNQDFRALERLGQLITQVAGRAGRAEVAGEVIVQTHVPDHPLLNTLIQNGYDCFSQALLKLRQQAFLPPYAYMALFSVQGKQLERILKFLHTVKNMLAATPITLMGPAPAPLAKKAGHHRMQLLLKSSSRQQLQVTLTALRAWIMTQKEANNLRWTIDVDPLDLS